MLFSSGIFLFLFLPICIGLYLLTPYKNLLLLAASLLFYAWGEPVYVILLLAVIGSNYLFGVFVNTNKVVQQKIILTVTVIFNLGILLFFKYIGFFIENLNELFVSLSISPIRIHYPHLPLGISFFTFQAITYVVDIFRKKAKVERNFVNLALYISMFPQLIAGPIVRFSEIHLSIRHRLLTLGKFQIGIRRFIIGLAKKVLIADVLSIPADAIFSSPAAALPPETAWLGAICFTLQIYFDFSGYSDMAIGLGHMFGFRFPENFNYPYVSKNIREFWRRWHMTLSRWFRDYVYIPLGGNRKSPNKTLINLLIVFALTGMWHGAEWTFLVWGFYHGAFLLLERLGFDKLLESAPKFVQHIYTFIVVTVGWVFFRSMDIGEAINFIGSMCGLSDSSRYIYPFWQFANPYLIATVLIGALISINPFNKSFQMWWRQSMKKNIQRNGSARAIIHGYSFGLSLVYILVLLTSLSAVANQTHKAFIYFRF